MSIQQSHGIACSGYQASAVRTGYEQIIAQRAGSGFSKVAQQDGKVISRTDEGIVVEYKDGTKDGFQIGRRFGNASGLTIAHDMYSELQVGNAFKQGDVLMYNSGFFEKDRFNPKSLVWKAGVTVKTALLESRQTHEDASSISKRLSEKLNTKTTKVKNVVVTFDQKVSNLLKVGTVVEHDTILCVIQDANTSDAGLFDEESLNTLRVLSSQTPTAKVSGIIERIEVYYHGDKEDMSPGLRVLADASDREIAQRNRAQGKPGYTGAIDESFRVDGESLVLDSMAIRIYITSDVPAGIGD